ncbi:MAG: arylsulfatase [Planctomycetales bacterium]|nr:arylsulfatase [Planctomycetales bacterium]
MHRTSSNLICRCEQALESPAATRVLLVLAATSVLLGALEPCLGADERPNLLLIVADDLGYSDLGCFGGEIPTPHLDALAARGERWTQFYNTGRCCPSRAAILTGQYPHRVGLGHMTQDLGQPGYRGRLDADAKTIADRLAGAGYRCFLSGKWHLGTDNPTRHGFEEFYGTLVSAKTFWDPDHFVRLSKHREPTRRNYDAAEFYGTDSLGDYAIDFLRDAGATPDQPWFLYLAFNAPHFPLHARPEEIARHEQQYEAGWDRLREARLKRMKQLGIVGDDVVLSPRSEYWDWGETEPALIPAWSDLPSDRRGDLSRRMAIYAAMVEVMDRNVGRVLEELRKRGQLDNTLVLFTSDNGACAEWDPFGFDVRSSRNNTLHWDDQLAKMGQPGTFHSVGSGWANASNTPWRLYKHYNHEGGIASPAILAWPRKIQGVGGSGAIRRSPAHVIDIAPTFCHAAGIAADLPGADLLNLADETRTLFFEHQGNRAVRRGKWKLVTLRDRPWELYDLSSDRTERRDLAAQQPELAQQLATSWEQWATTHQVLPLPRDYRVGYLPTSE